MYSRSLCLNDAFTIVRARKPDISPNFHFMEQLHTFERQLKVDASRLAIAAAAAASTSTTPNQGPPGSGPSSLAEASMQSNQYVRQLGRRRHKYECSCLEFDCKCVLADALIGPLIGVSPDSGIEFDRWSSENTPK